MTTETGTITATHLKYTTTVTISNGGFELGDLTDWSTDTWGKGQTSIDVATDEKHSGTYSCCLTASATDEYTPWTDLIHSVDVPSNSALTFYSYIKSITGEGPGYLEIGIDDGTYHTLTYFVSEEGTWTKHDIDISAYSGTCDIIFETGASCPNGSIVVYIDDVCVGESVVTSATIEDNSKTWAADQFNTNGTFILTSGDVKGYSCKVLDTFENYIQVPTTFANIINNIDSGTTYYPATNQPVNAYFETGDMTGWNTSLAGEGEGRFATMYVQSSTVYSGSYSLCCNQSCEDSDYTVSTFSTSLDITGAKHLTFYYKMPVCDGGAETKLKVQVGAWDDPNVVEVSYTDVTNNWIKESIDISALTGTQTIKFVIYTGDPS